MTSVEVVLVVIVGVAAVGLIAGTLTVVLGRRRDAAEAARRDRRRHRRPRVHLDEDPIIAALGVGGDHRRRGGYDAPTLPSGASSRETS